MNGELFGYLVTRVFEGPSYLGGILVVDKKGIPIEFKYVEPIRPSRLQTVLYGNTIDRYIRIESVGIPLIESLEHKPAILFIREEPFTEESKWPFPIISISRYRGAPLGNIGDTKEIEEDYIIQMDTNPPIRVKLEKRYKERFSEMVPILLEIGQNFDIMEPFSRLEEAFKIIWRETRHS
jgi:hypothetical protein